MKKNLPHSKIIRQWLEHQRGFQHENTTAPAALVVSFLHFNYLGYLSSWHPCPNPNPVTLMQGSEGEETINAAQINLITRLSKGVQHKLNLNSRFSRQKGLPLVYTV